LASNGDAAPFSIDSQKARFSGGFIQLTESMAVLDTRLSRAQWSQVLQSMKAAGMTTVIIQHLVWHDAKGDHWRTRLGGEDDAVELILSEADSIQGMSIVLGLWNRDFPTTLFNQEFFDEAKEKTLVVVDKAAGYTRHSSFGGWYISLEPWNFKEDPEKIKLLHDYLLAVTGRCKSLTPGKPTALSCYFNPDGEYAAPAETTNVYRQVLAGPAVDFLMVQDGVGEYSHSDADCRAYFTAFQAACPEKVQLWGNLECFTQDTPNHRIPAQAERLPKQFANAAGRTQTFVTFDFFHYMNPNKYTDAQGIEYPAMCTGGPVALRKPLYDAYVSQFGPAPTNGSLKK
jgi:hypothetical protein